MQCQRDLFLAELAGQELLATIHQRQFGFPPLDLDGGLALAGNPSGQVGQQVLLPGQFDIGKREA